MGFSGIAIASAVLFAGTAVIAAPGGSQWISAGGDLQNTRSQPSETKLNVNNVGSLTPKWAFTTGGDVSATPAVDGNTVYVPDWAGNLYAINKNTGSADLEGEHRGSERHPVRQGSGDAGGDRDKVIIGTQGSILVPGGGPGGKVLAFDKPPVRCCGAPWLTLTPLRSSRSQPPCSTAGCTSALRRRRKRSPPSCRATRAARSAAACWRSTSRPARSCGRPPWRRPATAATPCGAVRPPSTPSAGQLYIATGNNYSVPPVGARLRRGAARDPEDTAACLARRQLLRLDLALDLKTGAVRWATRAIPFDAWTVDCLPPPFGDGSNCPEPEGPDYDFGQAPGALHCQRRRGQSA